MKTVPAREAKNRFGRLIDDARVEAVTIEKHGRAVAVVMSASEYERLSSLEDTFWAARAETAEVEGRLTGDESEALLRSLLRAAD